ncbi:hypothetical protein RQP46_008936 [Phenoliferia psychrophenolica]
MDTISISELQLRSSSLPTDLWQRAQKEQPLVLSLSISTSVASEASLDSLQSDSLNYGTVTKCIEAYVAQLSTDDLALEVLADQLAKVILFDANAPNVRLDLARPRALLSAQSVAVEIYRTRADYPLTQDGTTRQLDPASLNPAGDKLCVRQLRKSIIIGVNPCERVDEQEVLVDLEFGTDEMAPGPYTGGVRQGWVAWRQTVKSVESHLAATQPLTIEAITTSIASLVLTPPAPSASPSPWSITSTSVRLSKPSALVFARYPSVQVVRSRRDFFLPSGQLRAALANPLSTSSIATSSSEGRSEAGSESTEATDVEGGGRGTHDVVLGVGTNMGERVANISSALKELEKLGLDGGKTKVTDTSFMYESDAMYVTDQAKFLNAVVKIETTLEPQELLDRLKAIETTLGREKTVRNGPRVIDLDILFYDDLVYSSDSSIPADRQLHIPHVSIAEREFVLRPLADLVPSFLHPTLQRTPSALLATLLTTTPSSLHRVLPLSPSLVHPIGSSTLLMTILNATPDSFSDGGDNLSLASALASAASHVVAGSSILDVGGMSTRPNADPVSESIEISRVVPLITSLRSTSPSTPISIDTFRPAVARAAIEAGATIINDVLGGDHPSMLETMAELDVPVIIMHSRGGEPFLGGEMKPYATGVVTGVRDELRHKVERALQAGVRRWNIILDPGVGFAKTGEQNVELLRDLPKALGREGEGEEAFLGGFPSLVGLSRKRFLGTLIAREGGAKERDWATAVAVAKSIEGGADIVRVHEPTMGADVVKVSDALYRGRK